MLTYQLKPRHFLVFTKKRTFTDPVAWTIFFLIAISFRFLYHFYEYYSSPSLCNNDFKPFILYMLQQPCGGEGGAIDVLWMVIRENLFYTIIMLIPVYINLIFFKKHILDKIESKIWSYSLYLILTFVNALLFAFVLHAFLLADSSLLSLPIGIPFNVMVIMGIQFIASGLVYRREVLDVNILLKKYEALIERRKRELAELQSLLEINVNNLKQNHVKIGSKSNYKIVQLIDVLYLQAYGNEPMVYTAKGRHCANHSLTYYENLLPESLFIRVHRSYIIAKSKVVGRKGKHLLLDGVEELIPIGDNYKERIDADQYLGFTET